MHHCRLMKAGMPRRRAAGRVACGRDRRLRETVSGRMNAATDAPPAVSRQVTAAIALGTLLNPLNSSMIAVAVVAVQRAFDVGVATSTWLLSGFYLTACVGQPLMGRIADRFGPRRVYCTGLAVVFVTGVLAAVAPGFWWVLACRIVQAAGTSAAYPAGLAMIRRLAGTPKPPAAALAAISVTNASSAAFGPVLGGFLVSAAGWRAVFVVNIPLTVAGLAAAVPLAAGALVWRELRVQTPFLDLAMLGRNRTLLAVLGQQVGVQFVFYAVFFGLPQWLERVRHLEPNAVGLLMLPIAVLGVSLTPIAARLVTRHGPGVPLLAGSVGLLLGSAALLLLDARSSVVAIVALSAMIGLPNGLNNLGLQAALYSSAPASQTGLALRAVPDLPVRRCDPRHGRARAALRTRPGWRAAPHRLRRDRRGGRGAGLRAAVAPSLAVLSTDVGRRDLHARAVQRQGGRAEQSGVAVEHAAADPYPPHEVEPGPIGQ